MLPPTVPPARPPTFNAMARRVGTGLTLLVLVIGLVLTLTGTLVAPVGAPFLALGGLGLLVIALEVVVDRLRLPRRIPLDPDTLRRSRP